MPDTETIEIVGERRFGRAASRDGPHMTGIRPAGRWVDANRGLTFSVKMVDSMLRTIPLPREALILGFDSRLGRAGAQPFRPVQAPLVLCHYTTFEGLRGILTEQVFRATDHHDVDDEGELKAAEDRVDAVVAELESEVSKSSADLFAEFSRFYSDRRLASFVTVYLSCFTAVRDRLYHWREFARDGGACLVLKALPDERPPNLFSGFNLGRSAHEVVYDPGVWEARIRTAFRAVLREHDAFAETAAIWDLSGDARRKTIVQLATTAALAGISSKDPKYREEAEWRWIAVPNSGTQPPIEESGSKRYLPLRFRSGDRKFDVEEVIVRGSDPALAMKQAREILTNAGYPRGDLPPVRVSDHPFPSSADR